MVVGGWGGVSSIWMMWFEGGLDNSDSIESERQTDRRTEMTRPWERVNGYLFINCIS